VWFETPTNPLLKVIDIVETVKIVRAYDKNIVIVVDNTFMTPFFQRPLELGVDIVMHSLTKYINGHSDVLMGAAMTNREDFDRHLLFSQSCLGTVPSPFDCYMVCRGIKTLHLRMKTHMENGLAVAKWLESNPRVEKVLYPELESHPQHKIHKKQSTGMSGMLSVYLKGGIKESEMFFSSIKVVLD
jgi:cystathionine gamma-lyase